MLASKAFRRQTHQDSIGILRRLPFCSGAGIVISGTPLFITSTCTSSGFRPGSSAQFILVPARLNDRSEGIVIPILSAIAEAGPRARPIEVIEKLVHGTTEVVQRLSHISRERSVEYTLQTSFRQGLTDDIEYG
jgi:hypothetical protein